MKTLYQISSKCILLLLALCFIYVFSLFPSPETIAHSAIDSLKRNGSELDALALEVVKDGLVESLRITWLSTLLTLGLAVTALIAYAMRAKRAFYFFALAYCVLCIYLFWAFDMQMRAGFVGSFQLQFTILADFFQKAEWIKLLAVSHRIFAEVSAHILLPVLALSHRQFLAK
jgi:hypothetical protein